MNGWLPIMLALTLPLATTATGAWAREAESEDAFAALPAFASGGGRAVAGHTSELAGLVVNGRELPEGVVLVRDAEGLRHAPLAAVARALGLELRETPRGPWLATPLGSARFEEPELRRFGGERYVVLPLLAERLAARVAFEEADFALRIDLPWDPSPPPGASPEAPVRPERLPARAALTELRGEAAVERAGGELRESLFAAARGTLGPGRWHARLERDAQGARRLRDWQWQQRADGRGLLLGHQLLGVHPLLGGLELTGVQGAWVEGAPELLAPADPTRLVGDAVYAVENLRGEGPPGGIAELRIDGRTVARLRIPLDGRFEFLDVRLPPGYVRLEILLYPPFGDGVPAAVLDLSGMASPALLPEGGFLIHGGIGEEGNPLDGLAETRGAAGFARARRAFGPGLTLEGALLHRSGRSEGAVGAVGKLGALGVGSLSLAAADGAAAWLATLEGERGSWFWRLFLREEEAGFREGPGFPGDARDHYLELGLRRLPRLEISLIGRERAGLGNDARFLRPALRFQPRPGLALGSRPDFLGEYVHDLAWQIDARSRLYARRDAFIDQLGLERRLSDSWFLAASAQRERRGGAERLALVASYQDPGDVFGWYADLGLLAGRSQSGWLFRAGRELLPGLRLRAEALSDPFYAPTAGDPGERYLLALAWDLGRAPGGFTRAGLGLGGRGAVAARIVVPEGFPPPEGVGLRVGGQLRGRSDAAGRVRIPDLAPGVHRVELDEEGLPLELSAVDRGFWVEVADGAVTEVEFRTALRLGVVGSVSGAAAAGRVRIRDAEGPVRAEAELGPDGVFRVDGLPPGRYRLEWLDASGRLRAARDLELRDRYLTGIELRAGEGLDDPGAGRGESR